MKIKVCGMKHPDNIAEVAALQPDYLGFIYWDKSPRYFTGDTPSLPATVKKAGVFVDASLTDILEKVKDMSLDLIQLHGNETSEFCGRLKKELNNGKLLGEIETVNIEIIKAIGIGESYSFKDLKPYEAHVDYFLFDTKGPLPGGNGFAFNWELLKSYSLDTPFFLSGGIGLSDLDKLGSFLNSSLAAKCHAIDVNSAFEIQPGLKNKEALETFIKKLKH